jgi:hypothetical protein
VEESDRSKGDDSNDATSDVPIAVLDVNDTRTSDLFRSLCCDGCQTTRTLQLVQAMRSANVRADAIVFDSALSAYARNRLTLWKPAR